MPKPEQTYSPTHQERRRKNQYTYYPQARAYLSLVFETFDEPTDPLIVPVLPQAVTVFNNSYKEADTWSIDFDAKDMPVNPELLRAGSAEIYLFQTPGIGEKPEVIRGIDDPETEKWEGLEPTITGLFDDVEMDYSDGGRTVSVSGTDYTSLFIAKPWRKYKVKGKGTKVRRAPAGKPLDTIIGNLMREVDGADALNLVIDPGDLAMPVVGAAEGKTNAKGVPVKDADNYWDVMYTLATRHGYIIFVRNNNVVLTTPQAYLESRNRARKMAWGRNLTNLRINRRMGNEQVPIVQVRSYDSKKRRVAIGQYPRNRKQKPVTGLGTDREEVRVYTVPGVTSAKQLQDIAEMAYNLLARAESVVEIETRDLLDLEGEDLINLRTGDAVTIGFEENSTELLEQMSLDQRHKKLVDSGFEPLVAFEIALGFDRLNQFRKPFRVKEASLDWDSDSGLTISATLQNFVNITGQEP